MASEPLPDHYKALGVDRNADAAIIKATYRKLVLKCHPDKVTDPTLKQQATDQFHQIQQAYETLVDDEKRSDYEAHLTLEKLRREKAARGGSSHATKSTRFDGGAPSTSRSGRYATEERRPSQAYDEDRFYDDRARASYDTYDAFPKTSSNSRSTRTEKEAPRSTRPAPADRTRSDLHKTRAKEGRSDRKFNSVESESSSDEKARYEASYKRRSAEDELRKQDDARMQADMRRKAEDRRSYEESRYAPQPQRKMSSKEEEAIRYQHKSRGQVEAEMTRPSPTRASSRDYYAQESRSSRRDPRPEPVRRSSARPSTKERTVSSSGRERDRGIPEIVDWGEERRSEDRRPPPFKHSSSSPANIEIPRAMPQRSYTEAPRDSRRSEKSPPPSFSRSATMPSVHSSSRRKEATPVRPSGLRHETITPEHSSPEREYSSIPHGQPSSNKKTYYYATPGSGGVTLRPEDVASASKPRTVLREPGRQHQRSPSPLGKPPIGANRPAESSTASHAPKAAARPPPPDRTTSTRHASPPRASDDRGRTRPKLFREVSGTDVRRGRQASYAPSNVQYAPSFGPEDVRWAPRGQENERDYAKPSLSRAATFAY